MIYRLDFERECYSCINLDQDDMEDLMGDLYYPEGLPLSNVWVEMEGELYDGLGKSRQLSTPDIASWEGTPVLNERAYQLLAGTLEASGEFLPIKIEKKPWFVFNTLATTNAVDLAHSEQNRRGGIYLGLKSLQFLENKMEYLSLFKTDFDEKVGTFCTEAFKSQIIENAVTGVKFRTDLHRP
ncbi:DUF1629 domain-containing protein [uncultured Microbulbifer sp.]|uniref:imm11 family protein n=1 Tax=uncultured Microbulbifer sp. TaxID=348147 RepID=UPI002617A5CB|nr:DUF1629 domain-containing protein [uncultured Microbulbifer sp.]